MSNISMYRRVLGYMGADKTKPIYQHMAGALVTNAVISCCECRKMISGHNGPRQDAWCVECTDEQEVARAVAKKDAKKKAEAERLAAKQKAKAEADADAAKKKAEGEAEWTIEK